MKQSVHPTAHPFKRVLAWTLSALLSAPGPLAAAPTQIADEPLALPTSSVKPNVMLILDDSGSMEQQYTPDFLGRRFGGSNALCFDSADGGLITSTLENCEASDPPLMTPDFNTQYYSPEIRYFPAVNFDGSSKPSMISANTTAWTAVPTDAVSSAGVTTYQNDTLDLVFNTGTTVVTANLAAGYPDRAWCATQAADHTNPANFPGVCRLNSAYTYPNLNFGFGLNSDNLTRKYVSGAPYFYRIATTEHCTDPTFTNCVASTTPTATHPVPAKVRFCDSATLTNCQAKLLGSFTRPKFTGIVVGGGGSNPASRATATITVTSPQSDSSTGAITAITFNGNPFISAPVTAAGPISPTTAAVQIRDAINANTAAGLAHGYTASVSSNVVTLTAPATGPTFNGFVVNVASTGTPLAQARVTFAITNVSSTGVGESTTGITIGATPLIPASIPCPSNAVCGSAATARNNYMAGQIRTTINANTAAGLAHGYTASGATNTVTITAPTTTGAEINGRAVTVSVSAATAAPPVTATAAAPSTSMTMTGGSTSGDIETISTNFSGGFDANEGRANVGQFVRTNIVPFQNPPTNTIPTVYPKFPARTDCAAASCTYAEEMTNFANWYAYYRSRMQMAKTAIGRAFVGITDAFRVGFITINPSADLPNRFLAVNDFTAGVGGQKDLWYQQMYKQASHGATPLREALSRVGRYFGGVTSGINAGMPASPVQVACQPNFAILTTDGYWNGNAGVKLDGTAIGNQDSDPIDSYSTRLKAHYDGGLFGATDTLADVAMYYYKTDLRSDLADQVPTSTKDTASHQHMTTFTVGMGLAGLLNFDKAYESGTSADFNRLKISPSSGGLDWPVPAANAESTLDDLWHAAVNGRGTFFSAKDPAELADAISETLNSVNARVGAGAAAATSNLQPVAGDNFAFTAQYETVSWIGNIKARTIDLSTGTVAARELWAAATLLDQRSYETRRIFTYDANDTSATATVQTGPTVAVTSLTQVAGTATVTATSHGFANGALVQIAGATPAGYNIGATITFINTNSYSYPVSSGLASPATGTITAGPAVLQNGNRLKSFCWVSGAGVLSAYSGCSEVQGLSTAEMDYYLPTVVSPVSGEPALAQSPTLALNGTTASATRERLIDYLRGDTANETTGGITATDLFRARNSVMGDIINAQPAYVKLSPFSYNTGNFAGRDPYYQEFRTTGLSATRKGALYVASNDGFLHAFHTDPDGNPYFQTAGISTAVTSDDTFTGTLSTSPTAGEGSERWAYVPRTTLARMKRLADTPYLHRYLTDGTPAVGDVCFGHTSAAPCTALTNWRTVLVAGFNAGGRGYYALDVTDPDNPKALWELRGGPGTSCIATDASVDGTQTEDCNIGLSYGNAIIIKLPSTFTPAAHAGKWVALVTSGYNNSNDSTGDGIGHLYIVEMETGKILKRMSTGIGSTATPSGLGRINTWVDSASFDNTALTVYGGDLLGNLWRFQLQDIVGPPVIATGSVTRIATLIGPDGSTVQPISVKPELGEVSSKRVIFLGTGRFVGTDDKTDVNRQSIYAIKDDMASTASPTVTMPRAGVHPASTITGFVKQTLAASTVNPTTERTVATVNAVNFADSTVKGWFVDLPDGATTGGSPVVVTAGAERVNVDPVLQLGTLVIPSNVPSSDTCVAGGFGWINFLDYKTGGQVPGASANMASTKIAGSLVVGINVVQLPGGAIKAIVTTADNQQLTKDAPVAPSALQGRRVSWRELFFE